MLTLDHENYTFIEIQIIDLKTYWATPEEENLTQGFFCGVKHMLKNQYMYQIIFILITPSECFKAQWRTVVTSFEIY